METAISQIEKHFKKHNAYKRSRRLYDIQKLNLEEHLMEINRRKPPFPIETLDNKVEESFINSMETTAQRVNEDIAETRRRYRDESDLYASCSHNSESEDETNESCYRSFRNRIKAPDLVKMIGRKEMNLVQSPCNNEQQFNNFNIPISTSKALLDFSLSSPKSVIKINQTESIRQNPEITPTKLDPISKGHNKFKFNESTFRCIFDYSKTGKSYKSENKDKKEEKRPIELEKIDKGLKMTRVNPNPGIHEFYFSVGKEVPGQMNLRYNKSESSSNLMSKNRLEENSSKNKEEMKEKRISGIQKKTLMDCRDELCDYKFFNRESYRKSRVG